MKRLISGVSLSCLSIFLLLLVSCVPQETETEIEPLVEPVVPVQEVVKQVQLPVQYQKPSYTVSTASNDSIDQITADVVIKVGASIRSTQGPQPLWDILKRLAALKKMSVSWSSDVDQNVLVDVDIAADDAFDTAVKNLLHQVDYYHEMEGLTIVVRYKETRQFHVAMPFTKSLYETATGGNVLGSNEEANNIEGTIRLDSKGNEFDIWKNIQDNMDAILDTWSTVAATEAPAETKGDDKETVSRQVSASGNKYTIDKPIGLITVHAPRPLLNKLDIYFKNLKRELYKQVSIEAKIIEVHLDDSSSIGLNWNLLLKSLSVAGGNYGFSESQTRNYTNGSTSSTNVDRTRRNDFQSTNTLNNVATNIGNGTFDYMATPSITTNTGSQASTATDTLNSVNSIINNVGTTALSGVTAATSIAKVITSGGSAAISLAAFTFDSFLNAVKEQGQTTILSNPKLSVLNGQPALITVGRNVTYIDSIESDVNNETGTISYTVETERILSGVGMALTANILDDDEIILNLVPVTSELEFPIEYRTVGLGEVGLPIINVREMSTTVKVKDGEMLVIGGLISNAEKEDGTFIPGTSNLGFFKYLFGYEEKVSRKRELIILLKPRIIN